VAVRKGGLFLTAPFKGLSTTLVTKQGYPAFEYAYASDTQVLDDNVVLLTMI
jgi:hypothetical protein